MNLFPRHPVPLHKGHDVARPAKPRPELRGRERAATYLVKEPRKLGRADALRIQTAELAIGQNAWSELGSKLVEDAAALGCKLLEDEGEQSFGFCLQRPQLG